MLQRNKVPDDLTAAIPQNTELEEIANGNFSDKICFFTELHMLADFI